MKYIIKSTLCSVVMLSLVSCGANDSTEVEKVEELPIVNTDVARQLLVPQTKVYTATVEAENLNNIAPAQPNRIKKINVEVGDHVRAGQELVTLDSSNIDQLRINLEQIEREYNRAAKLLEIGAGTQQAVDQLKAQLDAAKSQYANLLENTVLCSPITGVVTARNYDAGDMTGTMPVLSVGQLSPVVKVMINVSENDLALIKAGMPVSVTFDAFPSEQFSAAVQRVYPTVDTSTRTFQVEVRIPNANERIKPGMFGRVSIDMGAQNNVVVPDRAIVKQTGSGNKYVYVLNGNTVSFKKVEIGQRLDNAYELISGINDGDTVIISGQSRLADGVEVSVQNRQ
ncbi:MAG: efflux RND transporter periplasmic adaptor subunit [Muribaculaceae bacterium]|nr:efflux RND transporter periplasmic adaptor subunit [Muribaculaceae bacterium]